jgi:DNA-binding MarR family transcriptional regulator
MKQPPERPDDLGWLLATVSHALTSELSAGLEDLSVTPRAYCVLSTALQGEYTQTALAQTVGLDKTTMVVTIDALERAGLVARRMSSTDRRARVIAVTEAGERTVREAEAIAHRVHEDVLSALPEEERRVFLEALNRLVAGRLAEPVRCTEPIRRRH